jgi:two-component system, NtrC family, sensor kinase
MPVLRTLSARILVGFAVLILSVGFTTTYVVVLMHKLGTQVQVMRERYLTTALKSKDLHLRQQDLVAYLSEDRTDEPYIRVQTRVENKYNTRNRAFSELRNDPNMARSRGLENVEQAIAELDDDYHSLFALEIPAKVDSLWSALQRTQFDLMMKRLKSGEAAVEQRTKNLANTRTDLVVDFALKLEENEALVLKFTIFVGGAAFVVALLITVWATITLRPLQRLRDAARRIAAGDYGSRIDERGPAEVADLAREFNVMGRAVDERERELVRSERLAAVGKMAAMITHEVRNPLSSIALNTELLEDELDERNLEAKELCRAITREVDRLTALTEEYLAFARLPRPKLAVEQANDVVGAVAGFVREDLMARGVALEVALAPELPLALLDAAQLRQCLLNLIRNATEAVAGRPSPRVALTTRKGPGNGVGATIEIEVADNGPGIAPEVHARLFDPFVSTKQGGTGLGLALTQQIIRDHDGELRVASQPDRGATFTVVLPRARAAPGEVAIPAGTG